MGSPQAANSTLGALPGVARFGLIIDGYEIASFSDLVAVTSQVDIPGSAGSAKAAVEPTSAPTVTLRRGLTSGLELWAWHQTVQEGNLAVAQKSVSLVMYGTDGTIVAKFWLANAWPSGIALSALKAGSSEILYETVTLACESIQRLAPD